MSAGQERLILSPQRGGILFPAVGRGVVLEDRTSFTREMSGARLYFSLLPKPYNPQNRTRHVLVPRVEDAHSRYRQGSP
jgi:hypothetical protein